MDLESILFESGASLDDLDDKKEHTGKKIDYIVRYVEQWIIVGCASPDIKSLCFIDGMSNAGIYQDGELGTASRVYRAFCNAAKDNPGMRFSLIFNDHNVQRIAVLESVCNNIRKNDVSGRQLTNLELYVSSRDVNDFIASLKQHEGLISGRGNLTLLFIDPYNARTVDVVALRGFMKSHYCELFFNWFSSDHVRNKDDGAIRHCFEGIDIPPGRDASDFIADYLAPENAMHFSYPFKTRTNSELYQIIFVTPHIRGLEKLKDALWDTFDGQEYHRNTPSGKLDQISIFDLDETHEWQNEERKREYGKFAQDIVLQEFSGRTVAFDEIEQIVLQRSMLKSSDVIRCVITPLINVKLITKLNMGVARQNYKKDHYRIGGSEYGTLQSN